MIDRLPPQSIEAEQSVLGSVLIDRDAIVEVAEFLRPDDFYRPANGVIYGSMLELFERREPVDIVTVAGGLSLIRVTDDGHGMDRANLDLAVERHATSKLPADDLLDIRSLGFRGEALPSIGSVGSGAGTDSPEPTSILAAAFSTAAFCFLARSSSIDSTRLVLPSRIALTSRLSCSSSRLTLSGRSAESITPLTKRR